MTPPPRSASLQARILWWTRARGTCDCLPISTTSLRTMPRRSKRSPTKKTPPSSRPSGERATEDERLFETAPAEQADGFTHTDPWRVLRITGEFVAGFDELA